MFSIKKPSKGSIPKFVVKTVVGACVSATVDRLIYTILDEEEMTAKENVTYKIGAVGIGAVASNAVGEYTDATIDEIYEALGADISEKEDVVIIENLASENEEN